MLFIKIPQNNLLKRPLRTLLTCFGVVLGVASFVALVGLSRGVERAWITGLNEKGTHILGLRKGAVEILTATLDENLGGDLRTVHGVAEVSGELVDITQLDEGPTVLISGWPSDSNLWRTLHISVGGAATDLTPGHVVVGQTVAGAIPCDIGHVLGIGGRRYTVHAVHKSKGTLNNNTIIMRLDDMQQMTGKAGRVTGFNIRLNQADDPDQVADVLVRLKKRFGSLTFHQTREVADNNKILKLFRAIAWGTSTIAIVISAFIVLNTLLMSVSERKREIGIFCALGWKPSRIILMIGCEAFCITAVGGLVGCLVGGVGLHWLVGATELQAYIEPDLNLQLIVEILIASVGLGTMVSIYPAWRALQINPTEALRYE